MEILLTDIHNEFNDETDFTFPVPDLRLNFRRKIPLRSNQSDKNDDRKKSPAAPELETPMDANR
jgi:hypothetical protein